MNAISVLVVDDGLALTATVRLFLAPEGHTVLATSCAEAIQAAIRAAPDVIVLHLDAGETNALCASLMLRQNAATREAPVVCVADNLARAIRMGVVANEWIAKPVARRHLSAVLARCVARHRARSAVAPDVKLSADIIPVS